MADPPSNQGSGKTSTNPPSRPEKPGRYDFSAIEARWQKYWNKNQTFRTLNPGEPGAQTDKPKFYVLDMFPYPSGSGLHVGHPVGYCATDIIARYKRMCGFNVLHPMGFDAFGLPTEQYAIEHNVHPSVTTKKNIDRYREQLQMFGFSYDWNRELATCDPSYYKFTQWIFLQMFESWYDDRYRWKDREGREIVGKARPIRELIDELESGRWGVHAAHEVVRESEVSQRSEWSDLSEDQRRRVIDHHRLAYLDEIPVNWCPALGTVLANEEVDREGRSDRGGHPVYRRPLRQWMLRITKYADRLLADLEGLDWPEPIKLMQRNWIGRSTGAEVVFPLESRWKLEKGQWRHRHRDDLSPDSTGFENFPDAIRVYTTRPDTLFGATYMVIAPENDLVEQITSPQRRDQVRAYVEAASHRSELDRTVNTKEKMGVFTGAYAINPVTGDRISIWVADYVLMGYGTGAIMAVPGSDSRDFEFARKYNLPIVAVVKPTADWIQQRLGALLKSIDQNASSGFDRVAEQFPELAESVVEHRQRSMHLSDQTLQVLREKVGADRLINHYVRHPQAWNEAFTDEGEAVNSPANQNRGNRVGEICMLNGLATQKAKEKIIAWLEVHGVGRAAVNFKMHDWIFSRQKYWGEPFPVLHGQDGDTIGLRNNELPVELPAMEDFKPEVTSDNVDTLPEPPLGRAKDWVTVERDGKTYRRDLNTMPQWAGSCWYYLRFIDPHNMDRFCDEQAERYWMPIDLYVGGAEHAVLHLLYARFWHKLLYDLGYVSTREPFTRLFNQGMIQSFAYRNPRGPVVGPDQVEQRGDDQFVLKDTGEPVTQIVAKMSKALKNVVNPDEIINKYGADTFRLYEMYMGPLETSKPWNTRDVPGLYKLCQRIWRLVVDEQTNELSPSLCAEKPDDQTIRMLHKTIKRITEDLNQLKFNTAIAAIFDFVNYMTPLNRRPRSVMETFIKLFSPFAPHLGEELWYRLGHDQTLAYEPWPAYDQSLARDESVELAIQICGKIKTRITVPSDADEKAIESAALSDERVKSAIKDKTIRKVIVVKGRLVNIVVN